MYLQQGRPKSSWRTEWSGTPSSSKRVGESSSDIAQKHILIRNILYRISSGMDHWHGNILQTIVSCGLKYWNEAVPKVYRHTCVLHVTLCEVLHRHMERCHHLACALLCSCCSYTIKTMLNRTHTHTHTNTHTHKHTHKHTHTQSYTHTCSPADSSPPSNANRPTSRQEPHTKAAAAGPGLAGAAAALLGACACFSVPVNYEA